MKILQISASYKPAYCYGGPVMSVAKLCEALERSNHEVVVYTTTANGPEELPVPAGLPQLVEGVTVRYFKRLTKDHSHFSPKLLMALWKTAKHFDIIHIHAWWNLVSVLSCCVALLRGIPVVLSPRGTLSSYTFKTRHVNIKSLFHKTIGRSLLSRCYLHATANNEVTALKQLCQPAGLFKIANFVKLPDVKMPVVTVPDQPLRIIFLSRIDEKKGLDLLFGSLQKLPVPFHLTIAGDGDPDYIRQLKDQASDYGIQAQISWLGFIYEDKFSILAAHDLLILPSYDENFGNVVIESLSVGTAVLVSKGVGLSDYISSSKLGWVCEHSEDALQDAILHIQQQHETRLSIRSTAPGQIRKDFDEVVLTNKYQQMYQQIHQSKTNQR